MKFETPSQIANCPYNQELAWSINARRDDVTDYLKQQQGAADGLVTAEGCRAKAILDYTNAVFEREFLRDENPSPADDFMLAVLYQNCSVHEAEVSQRRKQISIIARYIITAELLTSLAYNMMDEHDSFFHRLPTGICPYQRPEFR